MGSNRQPVEKRADPGRTAPSARPAVSGSLGLPALQRMVGNRAIGELLAARSHDAGCGDGCGHGGGSGDATGLVEAALRGSGRPLEAPFQREMESTFQSDLSTVREFRGPVAERAAAAVEAKAFTIGNSIVYGAGSQSRETRIHELTHVVKPITRAGSAVGGVNVTDPGGSGEREAEANARRITSGGSSSVIGEGLPELHE
ncbi:eCIS core domain-containing protein [Actinoplanes sp. HUAS TT8]|uniref:eCIS core domain-containing protein n=1 Tax=Actinoplanes sp. HUAS TT8 TaxID=3447453 RepID=UPI003F521E02